MSSTALLRFGRPGAPRAERDGDALAPATSTPVLPAAPTPPADGLVDPRLDGPATVTAPRIPRAVQRLLGPVLLVGLWQLLSSLQVFDPRTTPSPQTVLQTAWGLLASQELQAHLWASLLRVLQGLGLGLFIGLSGAIVSGLSRWGENVVDANMEVLRAVPNFALLPVLIAWFGIGEEPKIALITLSVLVAIYINTYSAIRNVDAGLVEAARTFGVGRRELVTSVILPGALPGFLVGLRLALTGAWLSLIFAETINAPVGLGRLMSDAREYFRIDVIFVLLAVYATLGLASLFFVRFLEARLLTWRRAFDGA